MAYTPNDTTDRNPVTIGALNTMWNDGVVPLWRKLAGGSLTTSPGKGSSSHPIYIDNNGYSQEIYTISLNPLNDQGVPTDTTVASFKNTASNIMNSTVEIKGAVIENSIDVTSSNIFDNTAAALKVNGGILCNSGLNAKKVYHAVWNDISDAIEVQDDLKTDPGYCYFFDGTEYHRTTKYCQKGIIGIHSDTAGSILGRKGKHKELDISVGGFVLAYVDKYYQPGTPLTSAPDGKLTKMSLWSRVFHPERLVATYWKPEMEAEWGDDIHTVEVNGRHWVKVK